MKKIFICALIFSFSSPAMEQPPKREYSPDATQTLRAIIYQFSGSPQLLPMTQIKRLIHEDADPNASYHEITLLYLAIDQNMTDLALPLLALGVNPNSVFFNGSSALHNAIANGAMTNERTIRPIVTELIKRGADVNSKNKLGNTILMTAAQFGSPLYVHLLLSEGALPLKCNERGITALDMARWQGNSPIIQLLENAQTMNRLA